MTSIKNNVTTSIAHIHSYFCLVKKTIHYVINITSAKTKLFAIRHSINQTTQISKVSHIIIITDIIHVKDFQLVDLFLSTSIYYYIQEAEVIL